jgi:phage shock protein PspC (stress-responsive transcriptional regulator)
MSIAAEIERLNALRERGALTDDEFAQAKARLLAGLGPAGGGSTLSADPAAAAGPAMNKLRRSRSDSWLGGVCGGISRSLGAESWILRLLLVILALFGGTGVVIYLLLWIFVPLEDA